MEPYKCRHLERTTCCIRDEPINQHHNIVFQSDYDVVAFGINITVKATIGHLSQAVSVLWRNKKTRFISYLIVQIRQKLMLWDGGQPILQFLTSWE